MANALSGGGNGGCLAGGAGGDAVLPGDRGPCAEPCCAAVARVDAQLASPPVGYGLVAGRWTPRSPLTTSCAHKK